MNIDTTALVAALSVSCLCLAMGAYHITRLERSIDGLSADKIISYYRTHGRRQYSVSCWSMVALTTLAISALFVLTPAWDGEAYCRKMTIIFGSFAAIPIACCAGCTASRIRQRHLVVMASIFPVALAWLAYFAFC